MTSKPATGSPASIRRRRGAERWLLGLAAGGLALPLHASVVFDGSLGPNPAGSARGGLFQITQDDGVSAGGNLFHSFSHFGVDTGEQATFSHHSPDIRHIVARVTGFATTDIHGSLQVRQDTSGTLLPSRAALWLMNPNGIVIGDGASLDAQSTFVFSTANRVGFANGDSFHAHDLAGAPLLSVADPAGFGFLDRQDLAAGVTPGGIVARIEDPSNANAPLFLSSLTLVGSSVDPSIPGIALSGDITGNVDPASFRPGESGQFQANLLDLVALAPGGSVDIDLAGGTAPTAAGDSLLGGILIENSNLLVSDGPGAISRLTALGGQMVIVNSHLDALALGQSVPVSLRAGEGLGLLGSVLQTGTGSAVNAGDIRVVTRQYQQFGGLVSSRNLAVEAATGNPGNLLFGASSSLSLESFLLQQGQIISLGNSSSDAGSIILNVAGDLMLAGSENSRVSLTSLSSGQGSAGDILLAANRIRADSADLFSAGFTRDAAPVISLQAGDGGMHLSDTSLLGASSSGRTGATIGLFSTGDLTLTSGARTALIATGTSSSADGGDIFISADGDLSLRGSFDISSNSSGDTAPLGNSGIVSLSGRNVSLATAGEDAPPTLISSLTTGTGSGGTISLSATDHLQVRGEHTFASGTVGPGNSGAVILEAGSIDIESPSATTLSTSSLGTGDAGIVSLSARDSLHLSGVSIDSVAAAEGAAGFLLASGSSLRIDNSSFSTSTRSSDSGDVPAQIFLEASDRLHLSDSRLLGNSTGLAPAGQLTLLAGSNLLLENTSLQTATTGDGQTGSILLSSGGDLLLRGAQTELLSNALGNSTAGDVSLLAADTLDFAGGGFVQTSALGAGDAGTILLFADRVRLSLARIEGTAENAGGGDINIFGRDIQLDGNLGAGGIVFVSASSESSDALGNGGSITLGNPSAPAELILVRNSGLSASANAGNGGQININAEHFLRDARSIFQITSTSGAPGSLEINAPEQDISAAVAELEVALLDATALIQDRCAIRPEDASSLVISGQDAVAESHDSYLFSNHLTGSETQGHPDAPNRQGARGQEPVDWLAQTGGFECRQTP